MKLHPYFVNPFRSNGKNVDRDVDFLSLIPVFDNLSKRQKRTILSIIHERSYGEDEIIFRQGDPGVGFYIIREGAVDVFAESPDLTARKIAMLNEGDFFGEIALMNDSPRSATIRASERTVLWGLFKPDLLNLFESDPRLGINLVLRLSQIVAERLRLMNEEYTRLYNGT